MHGSILGIPWEKGESMEDTRHLLEMERERGQYLKEELGRMSEL